MEWSVSPEYLIIDTKNLTRSYSIQFCKFVTMETLLIKVPEQKSSLVKQLLKELGVTIESETKARKLAAEINRSIKTGPAPGMDEIVAEVKAVRAGQ